ncbi:MAG TPA: efflux RND transporter periplasmic adaptor subunit [Burkholderiales bacterium]|nr:efflux RND transporter periplasmic adaptor subunit [Burkholderiales bacterium]
MKNNRPASVSDGSPSRLSRRWLVAGVLLVIAAITVVFGILPRLDARASLKKETADLNVLNVSVMHPKVADAAQEIVLPGNMQAYLDTPIYARTNGYLKRWYFDIGARVRQGQLLADIDTPEVDDQLQQARADLATATANYALAEKTSERWIELLKTNSVSKQETDEKLGDRDAKKAALAAAKFNVARLEKLQSFKRIYAPFTGVITARNIDVGALIDAGSGGGPGKELFHLSSTDRLRVYVNVPQAYSREAVPGVAAELTLAEFPGRRFAGKLVRTAQAIDAVSRTLLAEVAVDNPTGELLPGAYAEVHLKLSAGKPALVVPVNTLLFRAEGMQVAVVKPDQTVALTKVQLGRDFGTSVEVVSGLDAGAEVVVNPTDSISDGARVRVVKQAEDKAAK